MSRKYNLPRSFRFAFAGLGEAIRNEPNFQIHVVIGSVTLILAVMVGLDIYEWIVLLFTISFVLILELFNTALEKIVDLVSPDIHPKAKIAKDVSAAAVLLAASVAIIIGTLLFLPKLVY